MSVVRIHKTKLCLKNESFFLIWSCNFKIVSILNKQINKRTPKTYNENKEKKSALKNQVFVPLTTYTIKLLVLITKRHTLHKFHNEFQFLKINIVLRTLMPPVLFINNFPNGILQEEPTRRSFSSRYFPCETALN
jgi:hypothetical protein